MCLILIIVFFDEIKLTETLKFQFKLKLQFDSPMR